MLKDRRALIEHDLAILTRRCGALYLRLVAEESAPLRSTALLVEYNDALEKLSKMRTELLVISSMIDSGAD
jgi:hypothetical protein